jgi:hypothetical protein
MASLLRFLSFFFRPTIRSPTQQLILAPSFVATLLHPIFFTSGASRQILVHEDSKTGEHSIERSIVMTRYWNVPPAKQMVFPGRKDETPVRPLLSIMRWNSVAG